MNRSGFLFFDSDLFVLLAGARLLPDLIAAVGFEVSDSRRLRPLPYMLERGRISKKYSVDILEEASIWCSKVSAVDQVPSPDLVDQLLQVPGIDAGEAFLLALAAASNSLVCTGDRRACSALHSSQCQAKELLARKVVGLETALLLLLNEIEYQELAQRLTPVRDQHQTLRVLLSQGDQTPEVVFLEGLNSFSRDLKRKAGNLLFKG